MNLFGSRTPEPEGLDRLVFEARHLRDHMVYLERSETGPALSAALAAVGTEGPTSDADALRLREALQASYIEVSAQVDKHTLREVLRGNPPHARNAPVVASMVLAVIGILHVVFAFYFTLWSSEGESLIAEMRAHQEFDDLAHAMELAELRAAIEASGGAVDGGAGPEEPHMIYYRGIAQLSQHYAEESQLPEDIFAHLSGFNPIRKHLDDRARTRCARLNTEIDFYRRDLNRDQAAQRAAAKLLEDPPAPAEDGTLLVGGDDALGGGVDVGKDPVADPALTVTEKPQWQDPRDDDGYRTLYLAESRSCPGQNKLRRIKLDVEEANWNADDAATPPSGGSGGGGQILQVRQPSPEPGSGFGVAGSPYDNVSTWVSYVDADAGRPNGQSANNVRSPSALRGMRETLLAQLEVVHRWFLPAIYGGLGSVVYCLWRILSPDLAPLGTRYVVLRTAFAALAAITLSMLLIPSQTLSLVAEPSRPFIYLLCFISGYSIEAFIAGLNRLNEMLTSRLTPREEAQKSSV